MRLRATGVAALALAGATTACEPPAVVVAATPPGPLSLNVSAQARLFPGSRLGLEGGGFLAAPAGETRVRCRGLRSGVPVDFEWPILSLGPSRLELAVTPAVLVSLGGQAESETLAATLDVTVVPTGQPEQTTSGAVPLDVRVVRAPAPRLSSWVTDVAAPGGTLEVRGADLLAPEEGEMTLVVSGAFTPDAPDRPSVRVEAARLPLADVGRDRTSARFALAAGVFGLAPGVFAGRARLESRPTDGEGRDSPWLGDVELVQTAVALPAPPPLRLARGQAATFAATGALPADAAAQTATVLLFEGDFAPADGGAAMSWRGASALRWVPEVGPGGTGVTLALRTQPDLDSGAPEGLGTQAGRLVGEVRMRVRAGREVAETAPVPVDLTVAPMAQAVVLDFTPGFAEGLSLFGLAAEAEAVKARIFEVARRDFAGLRVTFGTTPPAGAVEYTTVVVGGRDPNGLGLLGLENSPFKDTGNARLDERLGGRDAHTAATGAPAYGGIFVSSFLAFSPRAPEPAALADARFDAIFAGFAPALSEDAVPWVPGDTARATAAAAAVLALGNLLGSTVTHELGHALGLSAVPGHVHNPGDWPGDLMDRGDARPLAERAELDGTPPARFTGVNAAALARLLGEP